MTWHDPQYFGLFVIFVGIVGYIFIWSRKPRPSLQFSNTALFAGIRPSWRTRLTHVPRILKLIALSIVILTLARPQESSTKVKRNVEGIDIMLVLDISDSMAIEDMQPQNRMFAAKSMMKEFIDRRTSDRIGLVIFSGDAYTRVPPTLDYKLLLTSLDGVQPQQDLKMGTAIGVGLATAIARLRDSTAKSRVIVLLTDGENNTGTIDPETALDIAKGYNIRIYTIGIGQDGESQLPVITTDMFGRQVKHYQPIHSNVNEKLLDLLATDTGGRYYRATSGQALEKTFKSIDTLEKSKVQVNQFTKYTELFQEPLAVAVLVYLFSFVLSHLILRRSP